MRDSTTASASIGDVEPSIRRSLFRLMVLLLCVGYVAIELLYVQRTDFSHDEMQGALTLHRLLSELPYRDFNPYKTVLGYYIQLPSLLISGDPWTGLLLVRLQMVLVNATVMVAAALLLARHYRHEAVLFALLLLITMSTFLERSYEIRVDMLTAVFGLIGLLLLVRERFAWAGIVCALSFFVSQKGIYFLIASNAALLAAWLSARDARSLFAGVWFNVSALLVALIYYGSWMAVAAESNLVSATVTTHKTIVLTKLYDNLSVYWWQTLSRNPFFYGIGALHLLQLLVWRIQGRFNNRDQLLLVYGAMLTALCIWHKQPWPYFFVLLIPTVFVMHVSFFHYLLPIFRGRQQLAILLFVLMALLPLQRLETTLKRDSRFQQTVFDLGTSILRPGELYLDGMDLLYTHRQGVPELRWLDSRRTQWINSASGEAVDSIIEQLARKPIKLVIINWRLRNLPAKIQQRLAAGFSPLWGNLYVYSPTVGPETGSFDIKFEGKYIVDAPEGEKVRVDGVVHGNGDRIELTAGEHRAEASSPFRLQLLPPEFEPFADEQTVPARLRFMDARYSE